jgi:hypothetical protein
MLQLPLKYFTPPHPQGLFGAVRKHDIHTGIDLYCLPGEQVLAIEDGVVVKVCAFTGPSAGFPWWNDTEAVLVEGETGVFLYGEINPCVRVGDILGAGNVLGNVKTVLKADKGLPMTMLHLELYQHGYRGNGEVWELGKDKPEMLEDPSFLIFGLK